MPESKTPKTGDELESTATDSTSAVIDPTDPAETVVKGTTDDPTPDAGDTDETSSDATTSDETTSDDIATDDTEESGSTNTTTKGVTATGATAVSKAAAKKTDAEKPATRKAAKSGGIATKTAVVPPKAKAKGKAKDKAVKIKTPKIKAPSSRRWVPPTFIAVGLLGVVWLIVYYVAGQNVPLMSELDNWNILIGMGGLAGAFVIATLWR